MVTLSRKVINNIAINRIIKKMNINQNKACNNKKTIL